MEPNARKTTPRFVKIDNQVLINASRLMAVRYKPKGQYDSTADHYLAAFDTGQTVVLSPDEGAELLTQIMAITSESAT